MLVTQGGKGGSIFYRYPTLGTRIVIRTPLHSFYVSEKFLATRQSVNRNRCLIKPWVRFATLSQFKTLYMSSE
jgi:hypothetical protein